MIGFYVFVPFLVVIFLGHIYETKRAEKIRGTVDKADTRG